ncbi:hypothetical protein BH11BAC6_BH11BAC6_00950 [soil metagenome]
MKVSASKEKMLNKIKQALLTPVPVPFPQSEGNEIIFKTAGQEAAITFAEKFSSLLGRFSYCINEQELVLQLKALIASRNWTSIFCANQTIQEIIASNGLNISYTNDLAACNAAITDCELLIARTGSIVLSSAQPQGRTASVYAPVHLCIAYSDQLVPDIKDALEKLTEKYNEQLPSLITLATGPSRTADIEKTLVVGVHGPKEVFCFLIER